MIIFMKVIFAALFIISVFYYRANKRSMEKKCRLSLKIMSVLAFVGVFLTREIAYLYGFIIVLTILQKFIKLPVITISKTEHYETKEEQK